MSGEKIFFDVPFSEQLRWCTLPGTRSDARMAEIEQFARRHHDLILAHAKAMKNVYAGLATVQILFVRAAIIAWTRHMQGDPHWKEPCPTPPDR